MLNKHYFMGHTRIAIYLHLAAVSTFVMARSMTFFQKTKIIADSKSHHHKVQFTPLPVNI